MVEKYDVWYDPANENRKLRIYLPNNYYSTEERYPVVYMFDGQNLFFDREATYGTCWGMKEFLDKWGKKMIVVGIPCAQDIRRLSEYCPYDVNHSFVGNHEGAIEGRGDKTMQWIIQSLKPHIDNTYRTYPLRECTAIAGSSMGGIMALYAVLRYNQYFSKAAVISPALGDVYENFLEEIQEHQLLPDTRVFFGWGTDEWSGHSMAGLAKQVYQIEKEIQKSWCTTYINCQHGGVHNESSWRKQIPIWMQFLWFD